MRPHRPCDADSQPPAGSHQTAQGWRRSSSRHSHAITSTVRTQPPLCSENSRGSSAAAGFQSERLLLGSPPNGRLRATSDRLSSGVFGTVLGRAWWTRGAEAPGRPAHIVRPGAECHPECADASGPAGTGLQRLCLCGHLAVRGSLERVFPPGLHCWGPRGTLAQSSGHSLQTQFEPISEPVSWF